VESIVADGVVILEGISLLIPEEQESEMLHEVSGAVMSYRPG